MTSIPIPHFSPAAPPALVYVAGPVTGLTWAEATGWRATARDHLEAAGLGVLDPLRGAHPAGKGGDSDPIAAIYASNPTTTPRGIFTKCLLDVRRSTLIIADMSFASTGTIMELGWATALGKPVIGIMLEIKGKSRRLHPMEEQALTLTVLTVEEACAVAVDLLSTAP